MDEFVNFASWIFNTRYLRVKTLFGKNATGKELADYLSQFNVAQENILRVENLYEVNSTRSVSGFS